MEFLFFLHPLRKDVQLILKNECYEKGIEIIDEKHTANDSGICFAFIDERCQ
jgi:hypothetical protein